MKLPSSVPMPYFIGVVVFFALLYGSYAYGASNANAPAAQPIYITDGTGGNPAQVVNVNKQGHLSVHIADGGLPAYTGELYSRHMAYPTRSGLPHGYCYAAFIRGGGGFESATVHFFHDGAGKPQVLVRLDPYAVWVETGGANSTPPGTATGFANLGDTYVFGYAQPLSFKAFAGVLMCWHGKGTSDSFRVQMTIANNGSGPYDQEEYTIHSAGNTFYWKKLQGPKPASYTIYQTKSTYVSYLVRRGPDVSKALKCTPLGSTSQDCLHRDGHRILFVPHQYRFTDVTPHSSVAYPRFYLFENQNGSTPTRVGPFGDWSDE